MWKFDCKLSSKVSTNAFDFLFFLKKKRIPLELQDKQSLACIISWHTFAVISAVFLLYFQSCICFYAGFGSLIKNMERQVATQTMHI